MSIPDYLSGISRLFLDTAPVIYYVEAHPLYLSNSPNSSFSELHGLHLVRTD